MVDHRLEWLREYGVDPDGLGSVEAAQVEEYDPCFYCNASGRSWVDPEKPCPVCRGAGISSEDGLEQVADTHSWHGPLDEGEYPNCAICNPPPHLREWQEQRFQGLASADPVELCPECEGDGRCRHLWHNQRGGKLPPHKCSSCDGSGLVQTKDLDEISEWPADGTDYEEPIPKRQAIENRKAYKFEIDDIRDKVGDGDKGPQWHTARDGTRVQFPTERGNNGGFTTDSAWIEHPDGMTQRAVASPIAGWSYDRPEDLSQEARRLMHQLREVRADINAKFDRRIGAGDEGYTAICGMCDGKGCNQCRNSGLYRAEGPVEACPACDATGITPEWTHQFKGAMQGDRCKGCAGTGVAQSNFLDMMIDNPKQGGPPGTIRDLMKRRKVDYYQNNPLYAKVAAKGPYLKCPECKGKGCNKCQDSGLIPNVKPYRESNGLICTKHAQPLWDADSHPWRCDFAEQRGSVGDCVFVRVGRTAAKTYVECSLCKGSGYARRELHCPDCGSDELYFHSEDEEDHPTSASSLDCDGCGEVRRYADCEGYVPATKNDGGQRCPHCNGTGLDKESAKTRLIMPARCPSCDSSETRGRYHRGGWREYTCLDCGTEFKNRDSRVAKVKEHEPKKVEPRSIDPMGERVHTDWNVCPSCKGIGTDLHGNCNKCGGSGIVYKNKTVTTVHEHGESPYSPECADCRSLSKDHDEGHEGVAAVAESHPQVSKSPRSSALLVAGLGALALGVGALYGCAKCLSTSNGKPIQAPPHPRRHSAYETCKLCDGDGCVFCKKSGLIDLDMLSPQDVTGYLQEARLQRDGSKHGMVIMEDITPEPGHCPECKGAGRSDKWGNGMCYPCSGSGLVNICDNCKQEVSHDDAETPTWHHVNWKRCKPMIPNPRYASVELCEVCDGEGCRYCKKSGLVDEDTMSDEKWMAYQSDVNAQREGHVGDDHYEPCEACTPGRGCNWCHGSGILIDKSTMSHFELKDYDLAVWCRKDAERRWGKDWLDKKKSHVGDDKSSHHSNPDQLRADHPYWDPCGACGGDGISVGSTNVETGEQKQTPCKDCGGIGEAYDYEYWDTDDQLHDFANYPNFREMKIPDNVLKGHLKDKHKQDKSDDSYTHHQSIHGINIDQKLVDALMPKAAAKQSHHPERSDQNHAHLWHVAPQSARESIEQNGLGESPGGVYAWNSLAEAKRWAYGDKWSNAQADGPKDIWHIKSKEYDQEPDGYWEELGGKPHRGSHFIEGVVDPKDINRVPNDDEATKKQAGWLDYTEKCPSCKGEGCEACGGAGYTAKCEGCGKPGGYLDGSWVHLDDRSPLCLRQEKVASS